MLLLYAFADDADACFDARPLRRVRGHTKERDILIERLLPLPKLLKRTREIVVKRRYVVELDGLAQEKVGALELAKIERFPRPLEEDDGLVLGAQILSAETERRQNEEQSEDARHHHSTQSCVGVVTLSTWPRPSRPRP